MYRDINPSFTVKADNVEACSDSGFSLLETVIAMVIMLSVMAAALTLMTNALRVSSTTYEGTEAQQNVRIAQEYISRDLYNAADGLRGFAPNARNGFFTTAFALNRLNPTATVNFQSMGMIVADNNIPANTIIPYGNEAFMANSDRLSLLMRPDPLPTNQTISAMPQTVNGKTVYRSTSVDSGNNIFVTTAEANRLTVGGIYLLVKSEESSAESAFVQITSKTAPCQTGNNACRIVSFNTSTPQLAAVNTGVADFVSSDPDPDEATNSTISPIERRLSLVSVLVVQYYLDSQGKLIRRTFGENRNVGGVVIPYTDNIIAEGLVNLQFRYILRRINTDGSVRAPEVVDLINNEDTQKSVRQIEITTRARVVSQNNGNNSTYDVDNVTVTSPRNLQFGDSVTNLAP